MPCRQGSPVQPILVSCYSTQPKLCSLAFQLLVFLWLADVCTSPLLVPISAVILSELHLCVSLVSVGLLCEVVLSRITSHIISHNMYIL